MKNVVIKVSTKSLRDKPRTWYRVAIESKDINFCKDYSLTLSSVNINPTLLAGNIARRIFTKLNGKDIKNVILRTQTTERQSKALQRALIAGGIRTTMGEPEQSREFYDELANKANPKGILCPACGIKKPASAFSFSNKTRMHHNKCSPCSKKAIASLHRKRCYADPEQLIKSVVYPNMLQIIKACNAVKPERKLRVEFKDYKKLITAMKKEKLWDKFCGLLETYKASGFDRRFSPAISRIDKCVGYNAKNIRVLTLKDNSKKPREDRESSLHYVYEYKEGMYWQVARPYKDKKGKPCRWLSQYPTKEIATKFSIKAGKEIAKYGTPKIKPVRLGEWVTKYPKEHINRKLKKLSKLKKRGSIIKVGDCYRVALYRPTAGGVFPTREIAQKWIMDAAINRIKGLPNPRVTKRDWVALGYVDEIKFRKQKNAAQGKYTLIYVHKGSKFAAYISEPSWQPQVVNDLLVADLRKNENLTVKNITKLNWDTLPCLLDLRKKGNLVKGSSNYTKVIEAIQICLSKV